MSDAYAPPNPDGINGGTAAIMPSNVRPYETSADEGGSLPSAGVGGSAPAPAGPPGIGERLGQVQPLDAPGDPADLLTDGASFGPGAGPEALGALGMDQPTPDMRAFAKYLPTLELLAMQPGASGKVRQLVRMVKAQMPPEVLQELTNAARQTGRRG